MDGPMSAERLRRLAEILRAALGPEVAPSAELLEESVLAVIARSQATWPDLAGNLEDFFTHLGRVLKGEPSGPSLLPTLAYEDLWLAFSCSTGNETALRSFEREYASELVAACAQMRLTPERAQDTRQNLWQKLFVGGDNGARILEYSGRGALRQWFRVVVVRALLDQSRRAGRELELPQDDWVLELPAPADDPEVRYLKELYGREFRRAFEEAALGLSPEDRNSLRSYYAEKMSIDAMAAAFGIHRATAARRVERARANLVAATRERLAERLALSAQALASVIRMIESNFHLSVQRVLGEKTE
jgi:RNA polymerase sigma-70 factor (ECF subfamily)